VTDPAQRAPGSSSLGDAALTTSFVAVAVAGGGLAVALSLYRGEALIALSNLYVLSRIVRAVTLAAGAAGEEADAEAARRARSAGFAWGVLALGKIMLLFGGIWVLMTRHLIDPIPMVVGYGSLPIGIAIGAVVSDKTAAPPT
jgi:hypothetical protein